MTHTCTQINTVIENKRHPGFSRPRCQGCHLINSTELSTKSQKLMLETNNISINGSLAGYAD